MKMMVCENLHRIARELIMVWSEKWRTQLFELDSSESGETYDAEVTGAHRWRLVFRRNLKRELSKQGQMIDP